MQSCRQAARRISVETRHRLFGSRYRGVEVAPEKLWGKRCLLRTLLRFVLNLCILQQSYKELHPIKATLDS